MQRFLFLLAMIVSVCFLAAFASHAFATGHGQQAVIVEQYVAPLIQQQHAACVVEQFNAYSAPLVQRQVVREKVVIPQRVVQRQVVQRQVVQKVVVPQRVVQKQRFSGGGRSSSLTIQRQSSGGGGGFLRRLF